MDKQPVFFCVCSQKGGVGKSTFTILLASWLHYALGRDVLVVDCDAPQWSIVAQRERELDVLERNDRYKLMMVRLFKRTGRKIWPVVRSTPDEGLQAAVRTLPPATAKPTSCCSICRARSPHPVSSACSPSWIICSFP